MRKVVLVLLIVLLTGNHNRLQACSCEWQGPFLTVAKRTSLVAVVKVKKYIYYSGTIPAAMEVEIMELLKGDSSIKTAKVWGDTGMLCRPYISVFKSDSIWVLALSPSHSEGYFRHPDEKAGDYYIDGCGTTFLPVKQEFVSGLIQDVNYNDPPQTMSLTSFVATAKLVLSSVEKDAMPSRFELMQNYPNPFNPETTISYKVQAASNVSLKVYDYLGNEVATLVNEIKQPGFYNSKFSTLRYSLSSGVYFYQLRAGSYIETKKMVVMK